MRYHSLLVYSQNKFYKGYLMDKQTVLKEIKDAESAVKKAIDYIQNAKNNSDDSYTVELKTNAALKELNSIKNTIEKAKKLLN